MGAGAQLGSSLPEDPWMIAGPDLPVVKHPAPFVTVREAIGDLPRLKGHLGPDGQPADNPDLPIRGRSSEYARALRAWPDFRPLDGAVSGNWYRFTPRDFPIFRKMAQGDCYPQALEIANRLFREELEAMDTPPRAGSGAWKSLRSRFVPPYRNDAFHDKWKKLVAEEPSWTLTAHLSKDTYSHIHYDSRQARTITVREAARLQSFPDGVEFVGNYGDQFRQIGNAVPPLLARAIAAELIRQLGELGTLSEDTQAA
jgi:DNA (cytosine-5)-methyltransferase 1